MIRALALAQPPSPSRAAPRPADDSAEPARWLRWIAHAAVLPPLPSGIWRLAMSVGVPVGWNHNRGHFAWWAPLYAIVLGGFVEGCALLTLGFVKPWGLRAPRWLPLVGGRRVRAAAAILPATLASVFLTVTCVTSAFRWSHNMSYPVSPHGVAGTVMTAAYAPLLAWGPLLAIATWGYWLRVRPRTHQQGDHV
jgi:hypothetical protein